MPIPIKLVIVLFLGTGADTLTWAIVGVTLRNMPLMQYGFTVYMDTIAAFGIGSGCLAAGITAVVLFRTDKKPPSS